MVAKDTAFPAAASVPGKGIILVWQATQAGQPGICAELIEAP